MRQNTVGWRKPVYKEPPPPEGTLTLFDIGFFAPSVIGGPEGPHHNFVDIAPMIMKFGTGVELDVFYTMVTKKFVTSLLLRYYDVITFILANA